MGCIHCHDPHATKPRVIRDALIEAVVDRGEGTYPYDPQKSKEITIEKIMFKRGEQDFRAIGILNKPDSNLMCAQCHVEYNCNPGIDTKTGGAVGIDDRRTNYYPWVNVFDLQKRYESINFKDFKHAITGAALTKIQHPEVETYWGSKHERAGVECKDCHMPKVKRKGKEFTFHGQRSARYMLKDTCLRCHPWTAEQAEYQVDAVQNYVRGKMRKAEFSLGQTDRYLCSGQGPGGQRGRSYGSPKGTRPGPHPVGMVDGGEQRRVPQSRVCPPIPGGIHQCLSKRDRDSE